MHNRNAASPLSDLNSTPPQLMQLHPSTPSKTADTSAADTAALTYPNKTADTNTGQVNPNN